MKLSHKTTLTSLISLGLILFFSCERTSINQRAGTYIGVAQISCTQRLDSMGFSTETTIFSGTYTDTFTVEVIDIDERKYNVSRASRWNGPCSGRGSQYGIGDGGGGYILNEDFFWGYGYEYDKEWDSRLDLSDAKKLVGYMLQRDIFGSDEYDDLGNVKTTFRTFTYSITAEKQ